LRPDSPHIDLDYRIANMTGERKVFLWKLHAALNIAPGDRIISPARTVRPVDPAWSRWGTTEAFTWPVINGEQADLIPPVNGTTDFLFLYDLPEGRMGWRNRQGDLAFTYFFDTGVFPYCWFFASYGGFDNHYVAILEPCTAMPLSVNDAAALGQCSVLEPDGVLTTRVTIYAGRAKGERP
jgi:hypothetical protein